MTEWNYEDSIWYISPQTRLIICACFGIWMALTPIETIVGYSMKNYGLMICSLGVIIAFIELISPNKEVSESTKGGER